MPRIDSFNTTASIVSGKPYTPRGVRAVWEGGEANPRERMSGTLPHDELLYLGGNEQGSHKYISELLGKATIDLNTYGQSHGRNGNYSTNWQLSGRELLLPDEVRMLDNRFALLFIRGERPVMDEKYDILRHPNVALSTDGGAKPFVHGGAELAGASIVLSDEPDDLIATLPLPDGIELLDLELLSEEEVIAMTEEESKQPTS